MAMGTLQNQQEGTVRKGFCGSKTWCVQRSKRFTGAEASTVNMGLTQTTAGMVGTGQKIETLVSLHRSLNFGCTQWSPQRGTQGNPLWH